MKKLQSIFCLLLLIIAFSGCTPNENTNTSQSTDPFASNFGNTVNRDFIGQVVDYLGDPISNALVTIGTSTGHTDANGVFIIHGASVYEKFAYIIATKAGYITVTNSLIPTSGKNFVRMIMDSSADVIPYQIQAGIATLVGNPPLESYINVDGAFQDSNGTAYSGSLSVYFSWVTPSYIDEYQYFPGMLYGKREDGSEASLDVVYGLVKADLKGSSGQQLTIASGHTAQIAMKIGAYYMGAAPSTVPLWYFDEEVGYWKEEGFATKVGDYYIGSVSHLACWVCSTASPSVRLTFKMVDQNGVPLSNVAIELINLNDFHAEGVTDENGQFTGLLPAGQSITLNVQAGGCNDVFYTTSIGPHNSDANVPPITLNSSTHITGTLLKCNNANVTNGYVVVNKGGQICISEVDSSDFNLNEIYCPSYSSFTIKGVDYDNFQESNVLSANFTSPVTNVGTLHTCTSPNEFFRYQIDSNPVVNLPNITTGMESSFYISAYSPNGSTAESMDVVIPAAVGTFTASTCSIQCDNTVDINSTTQNTIQFNVTAFGPIGGFVDVTFNGTYTDTNNVSHTLSGQGHIRRDQ